MYMKIFQMYMRKYYNMCMRKILFSNVYKKKIVIKYHDTLMCMRKYYDTVKILRYSIQYYSNSNFRK